MSESVAWALVAIAAAIYFGLVKIAEAMSDRREQAIRLKWDAVTVVLKAPDVKEPQDAGRGGG